MLTEGDFAYKFNEDSDSVTIYDEGGHGNKMQISFEIFQKIFNYARYHRKKDHTIKNVCPKCGGAMDFCETKPYDEFYQCGVCHHVERDIV